MFCLSVGAEPAKLLIVFGSPAELAMHSDGGSTRFGQEIKMDCVDMKRHVRKDLDCDEKVLLYPHSFTFIVS